MNIIADNIQGDVAKFLEDMVNPVTVDFYPQQESQANEPMRQLLEELHQISGLVQVVDRGNTATPIDPEGPEDVEGPVTTLSSQGMFSGIRYLGFPGGHEFSTFLSDLVTVSKNAPTTLSAETEAWLKSLTSPLHLEVFITHT